MWLIDQLAEARIAEAAARGAFDDLPGAGRPLVLDDDALVPEELRPAYRLLKNAGYIPPELTLRREISDLRQLLRSLGDEAEEKAACARRLSLLLTRLAAQGREVPLPLQTRYGEQLQRQLGSR